MKKILIASGALVLLLAVLVAGVVLFIRFRIEGEYFDSAGVRIHYTVEGEGEPILLVHGVGANADLNWRWPGITRMFSDRYQVVAFDLRGHGLSDKPHDPASYGIELVNDIARLMDHLKIERAHIVGYSLGGFIALKMAVTHPERMRSMALCAAGWKDPADPTEILSPYRPPPPREPKPAPQQAAVFAFGAWTAIGESFEDLLDVIRDYVGDQLKTDRKAIKAMKKSFPELVVTEDELKGIQVPAICFIGTRDGLLPYAEDFHRIRPDIPFFELEGANHITLAGRSEFKRDLEAFVLEHSGT